MTTRVTEIELPPSLEEELQLFVNEIEKGTADAMMLSRFLNIIGPYGDVTKLGKFLEEVAKKNLVVTKKNATVKKN